MDPSPMAAHGYQLTASSTSASTDASTSSIQRVREQSLLLRRGQWDLWPESTVALGSSAWRWSLTSQRRSSPGEVRCNFFIYLHFSFLQSLRSGATDEGYRRAWPNSRRHWISVPQPQPPFVIDLHYAADTAPYSPCQPSR